MAARPLPLLALSLALSASAPAAAQKALPDLAPRARSAPGDVLEKPGGGLYFEDPHQGGAAPGMLLATPTWGRLVDVFALDGSGLPAAAPVFRDLVVHPDLGSDGVDYRLERSPVTGVERLVVLRTQGAEFLDLVRAAQSNLPELLVKAPGGPGPFAFLARNATVVLRTDDLLQDDAAAALGLATSVQVRVGPAAPRAPFPARVLFDPNHGGVADGAFHSTRVLVDLTVSELEAAQSPFPLPVQSLGLPASSPQDSGANVLLSLPRLASPATGSFAFLANLAGNSLRFAGNEPILTGAPTSPVVRALRSGNDADPHHGYLPDFEVPRVLGAFPLVVERASPAPSSSDRAWTLGLRFAGPCERAPVAGDVLEVGPYLLEAVADAQATDQDGTWRVEARVLAGPVPVASGLLGAGHLLAVHDPELPIPGTCWFDPIPGPGPGGIATASQFRVRFTEPIAPESARPFDTFRLVRGALGAPALAETIVVASPALDASGTGLSLVPLLPLDHVQGTSEEVHVEFGLDSVARILDLAGNALPDDAPSAAWAIDPAEPEARTAGVAMRFLDADEVLPRGGLEDLRGPFLRDPLEGLVLPRPVTFSSHAVDRGQPVPSIMIPFPPGVGEPLSPVGAKVQAVWRYADAGWSAEDETRFDLDVVGLSWAPIAGQVISEFYPEFEIRLGHSRHLPDEAIDRNLLPLYPNSGLSTTGAFEDNFLTSARAGAQVVHPRASGYAVSPANLYPGPTGRPLLPYPWNQGGGPQTSYTWRDTSAQEVGGNGGAGVPLDIETGSPLNLLPAGEEGSLWSSGAVPTVGLPLLMEFRCFASQSGFGVNRLDVSLAINSSAKPGFRAYSAGGVNVNGQLVVVDPDLATVPTGGFNPSSNPPGLRTRFPADPVVHMGAFDTVTRVTRVHTAWIATSFAPLWTAPLVLGEFPPGTVVEVDARGATSLPAGNGPFDATKIDPYGDLATGTPVFPSGPGWSASLSAADGTGYLQLRLSLINDVASGASPRLDSLGLAYGERQATGRKPAPRRRDAPGLSAR